MTLHLLKLCVGIDDVDHLATVQQRRVIAGERLCHRTRQTPRRAAELLDGGALYWVIRGFVRVRQCILDIDQEFGDDGVRRCLLVLDPALVRTVPQPRRPHQGWRYLDPQDAPADLPVAGEEGGELPPEMAAELRGLGLI